MPAFTTESTSQGTIMPSYMLGLRDTHNRRLLTNVLQQGLNSNPADQTRVYSYDKPEQRIDGLCFFYFPSSQNQTLNTANPLKNLLRFTDSRQAGPNASFFDILQQRSPDGLWNLALERNVLEDASADRYEWEERTYNNIVFIFDCEPKNMMPIDQSVAAMHTSYQAKKTQQPITQQKTRYILYPKYLEALVKEVFGIKFRPEQLIPVDFIQKQVTFNSVAYSLKETKEVMSLPNYAKAIEQLITTKKLTYPFCLHSMRLATKRDFFKLPMLSKQLDIEQLKRSFQPTKYKPDISAGTLLRRAAHSGCREDLEYLLQYYDTSHLNIDELSPTQQKTALQMLLGRRNTEPSIKTLLHYGAGKKTDDELHDELKIQASQSGYDLSALLTGEYDKKIYIEHVTKTSQANPQMHAMKQRMGIIIGQDYRSPQTKQYHPPKRGSLSPRISQTHRQPENSSAVN